jgi:excisionase family DNA binding protein
MRATIGAESSLVKRNYCAGAQFQRNGILWTVKLISTTEAARRLNVTPSRVRAMIASKRLKAMRVGIMWLIDPKDLDAVKDRKVGRPRKAGKRSSKR